MKKISILAALGLLALAGCNDESELDKAIKEGKEKNRKTSGIDREVPRVVLTPDKLQQQKTDDGGK